MASKYVETSISIDATTTNTQNLKQARFSRTILAASGLGWLAIVVTLVVFNGRGRLIASSFGCLFQACYFDFWKENNNGIITTDPEVAYGEPRRLASIDQNVLNALQLVAKLLEIWFFFIAGTLIYNLSMACARHHDGLPLQYLDLHTKSMGSVEFPSSSFWQPFHGSSREKGYSCKLYALLVLVAVLCVVSAVLGPAIAILLLPVRETAIISQLPSRRFIQLNSEHPPNITIPPHPISGRYVGHQPTTFFQRKDIDQLAEDFARDTRHIHPSAREDYIRTDIRVHDWLMHGNIWIPCRRVLDQLLAQFYRYQFSVAFPWDQINSMQLNNKEGAIEFTPFSDLDEPQDTNGMVLYDGEPITQSLYRTYKTTLDVGFRRHGPAFGLSGTCFRGNISVISVAKDMSVRCYAPAPPPSLQLSSSNPEQGPLTRCIRVGRGWPGSRNHHAQFHIHETNPLTNETYSTASIDFHSVSRLLFLNSSTRNCWIPMKDGQSDPSCDWNALFAEHVLPEDRATALNQQVVEYRYRSNSTGGNGPRLTPDPHVYSTTWCNSASHLAFGTYELAATQRLINMTGDTRLTVDMEPDAEEPVYIHPDWVLASWDVNSSGIVPADLDNPAAALVLDLLRSSSNSTTVNPMTFWGLSYIHVIIMTSALSIINYEEVLLDDPMPASKGTDRALENFITSEMWVYNLSSRTRILGFAVAVIGCVVVGISTILSIAPGPFTPQRSSLSLFREALTQHPAEALAGLSVEEVGQLPYRLSQKRDARGKDRIDEKKEKAKSGPLKKDVKVDIQEV